MLRLTDQVDGKLLALVTSASAGIRMPTWDRANLPLPFARVRVSVRWLTHLQPKDAEDFDRELLLAARSVGSSIPPPDRVA